MNKVVSIFTVFCFVFLTIHPTVYAAPPETIALFEGILFSKDLAARIEAERKTMITLRLSEIKIDTAVLLTKSKFQLKLDIVSGKFSALEEKHKKIMEIRQEQIDFLRKQYEPTPWHSHPAFLVTVGIIAGISLTIGAAHIVKTVK